MSVSPRGVIGRDWGHDDSGTPILHVDMDSFFASVEVCEDPSLDGKPVVVGGASARGVVTAATYPARAYGIRAGMPIGRARSACPHAVFLPGRIELYRQYSRRVMEVLARITPALEILGIDEAFLDVSGARRRLGPPTQVAALIRKQIRQEIGLPASVGVAAVKSVAKIASAHAKPDGVLLISADRTVDFLHGLPVGSLWGVGKATGEALRVRGVDTVGDLAKIPLPTLSRWIGPTQASALHALAWGKDERPVGPREREKSISTERTFEVNLSSREELRRFVVGAAHDCARRLRRADLKAWTVTLKVRDAKFATITRSKTLVAPTDVGREIGDCAAYLVEQLPFPRGGVRLAGVGVSSLVNADEGVPILLDEDPRPRAAELAMDAAQERFGKGALGPASLLQNP